ncbi:MAG: PfkB family carbohydrate kinase [Chloroflexota bacterium]
MNLVAFSNDHAAFGMRLWEDSVGEAAAPVGDVFNRLPDSVRHARGFHFNVDLNRPDLQMAADLRRAGGLVSMSPFEPADRRLPPESLYKLISAADIFSLDASEAESLVGPGSPRSLARRLVEAGESAARLIVLRMGEKGSWVVEGQTGQAALIPAFPATVADMAGAGDAYCGGFLAGWIESHSIAIAGLHGAVAASFAAGQTGLPLITADLRAEARRRLDALEPLVETSSI